MDFKSLGLRDELLRAVEEKGYQSPSPIQAKAIPAILTGKDVLAAAQTGTGKTAGFTLPLLQNLSQNSRSEGKQNIKALVLTPTRELAAQVAENVKIYSEYLPTKSAVVFGGVNINPQKAQLRAGVDILIATPGRLLDLYSQKALSLSHLKVLVLDEADRMLDMGFIHDIKKIIKIIPAKRQNLLFSATFSKDILNLTQKLLNDPISIEVAPQNSTADTVQQQVYRVEKSHKHHLLKHLIKSEAWHQVLVFSRTKHGADRLAKRLDKAKIPAAAIHGNKSQNARTRALKNFKDLKIQVLVATDIAARGLDIKQLPHVVNFELPNVSEDYVHRIGRTGRAGAKGHAVSLVSEDENKLLKDIEKLMGQKVESCRLPQSFVPPKTTETQQQRTPRQNTSQRPKSSGQAKNRSETRDPKGNQGHRDSRPPAKTANNRRFYRSKKS
jgi:ATP-dependent RNA helicase RhlE